MITAAIAELAYAIPHITYHVATHSRLGESGDKFGAIGGLILNVVIGVLLLLYASTRGHNHNLKGRSSAAVKPKPGL